MSILTFFIGAILGTVLGWEFAKAIYKDKADEH